ncbi:hypothetical protein [Lentzea aerocolonigenes]|uniref:hypothetical protein n=1 Tax=Lentzea aerocolonigenes TaxID=68170 RepID=UPI0004C46A65|nr:hypothetical protein [Lentzea aerocolonigenes]MCP2249244.1 hypothetical protein [Lentzea aerocolonigenes]
MRKVLAAALTGAALVGLASTASAADQTDFPWPPKDITPVHKTKAELQKQAEEFSAHQRQTFPVIISGAQYVTPGLWGGERGGQFEEGMQYMANQVFFRQHGERASVIMQVNAPGFFDRSPQEFCEHTTCTATVSDNQGGVIVISEDSAYHERDAHNFRPNGEVVWIQGSTQDDPAVLGAVASDRAYTFTR